MNRRTFGMGLIAAAVPAVGCAQGFRGAASNSASIAASPAEPRYRRAGQDGHEPRAVPRRRCRQRPHASPAGRNHRGEERRGDRHVDWLFGALDLLGP